MSETWQSQRVVAIGLVVAMTSSCTNSPGADKSGVAPASSPVSAPLSSPAPAPTDAASIASMRDASQKLLASTPKSVFDVDQKSAELGPDVSRIFAFVRDDIRHQIYAGVLRGARGTLTGRAGNAWDKAVLLSALLRHHGREVRFARGRLTPDRTTVLVTKMFDQAHQPANVGAVDVPASVAAQGRDLAARIETRWRASQADVVSALDRGGVVLGQTPLVPDALLSEEAADHAWVEYRDGDRWVPLDPSAAGQPGETATTAAETFSQIPDALYHRVTFRVKVERRQSQKLEERDVFIWPATAAALHGTSALFAHQIAQTPLGRWRATPVLVVDQQTYAALSFTDAGWEQTTKPADALVGEASRQVQGVGRINELFGGAAAPAASPAAAASELTAVWLDVEFTDPSGRSETVRREIVDRIGPLARGQGKAASGPLAPVRMAGDIPIALAGLYGCAITAGPLDPRLPINRATSFTVVDDALALEKLAASDIPKLSTEDQARFNRVLRGLPAVLEATAQTIHVLSQRLAQQLASGGAALDFYEATPRLAIVSFEPAVAGPTVDLRRNRLRVVGRGVPGDSVVRANLARGVLDAVIEDAVVESGSPARAGAASTVGILSRAQADGARTIAIRDAGGVGGLNAPEEARARIAAAVDQQVIVAARPASVVSASRFAWWQVTPATGEAIGVIDTGLHGAQTMPERAAVTETQLAFAKTAAGADPFAATQAVGAGGGWGPVPAVAWIGLTILYTLIGLMWGFIIGQGGK
jgi:large repetitive protein